MTFDEMAQEHLKALRRRGRSESTIANRRCHLAQLGTFLAGREATLPLLREWSDSLAARGLKVRSQWTAIVNARAFYNWAAEEEIIPVNFAKRLEKPRLPKHLPKAFTPEEVTKLMDTAATGKNPERDEALILFLLETGCRRAGAANLRISDLNLEAGTALLCEKGDKERMAFISQRTVDALRQWFRARDGAAFHGQYQNSDRVFGLGPWGLGLMVEDLGRRARIHATAHMFRHTSAVWRLVQGCDASTLQQLLGWSDLSMLPVYTTMSANMLQAQALKSSPLNGFPTAQGTDVGALCEKLQTYGNPPRPIRGRILPARSW
ncbi:MAG: tyrosine-type recombinase/integrase [Anaerolineales bacterium]|jgi:site-specific recombinase XerD